MAALASISCSFMDSRFYDKQAMQSFASCTQLSMSEIKPSISWMCRFQRAPIPILWLFFSSPWLLLYLFSDRCRFLLFFLALSSWKYEFGWNYMLCSLPSPQCNDLLTIYQCCLSAADGYTHSDSCILSSAVSVLFLFFFSLVDPRAYLTFSVEADLKDLVPGANMELMEAGDGFVLLGPVLLGAMCVGAVCVKERLALWSQRWPQTFFLDSSNSTQGELTWQLILQVPWPQPWEEVSCDCLRFM